MCIEVDDEKFLFFILEKSELLNAVTSKDMYVHIYFYMQHTAKNDNWTGRKLY